MDVHATGHDEARHEFAAPVYRVNFWEQPAPGYAFNLDAYVLAGAADVVEVQRWVDQHARGRLFELFLEVELEPIGGALQHRTAPLARLAGRDPNAHDQVVALAAR